MSKFILTAQLQLQAPKNTRAVLDEIRRGLAGGVVVDVRVVGVMVDADAIVGMP